MQSSPLSQEQAGLDLRAYLGMFLYHRWLVLCGVVVGLAFGIYQASGYQPQYSATAVIKVEKKTPDLAPSALRIGSLGDPFEQPFAEEVQILKSRAFLARVAQRLNPAVELLPVTSPAFYGLVWLKVWLLGYRDLPLVSAGNAVSVTLRDVQMGEDVRSGMYTLVFTDAHSFTISPEGEAGSMSGSLEQPFTGWGFSLVVTGGPGEPGRRLRFRVSNPEEMIARLRQSLSLLRVKDTSFLQITATASNPPWAQAVVQGAIAEYIEFGQQQRAQRMAQSLGYIDRQLEVVLNNVEAGLNAVRHYKEQHPLASLAEDTKGLVSQSASYEVQLRKVEENLTTAQALRDSLHDRSGNNGTGSLLLIQAVTLGDPKLVTHVEELIGLGEKKLSLGANYSIPDPASREIDLKTRHVQAKLMEYVSILMSLYKKQETFLREVLQDYEAKMQKLPELEQGLSRLTRSLKVYQDIYAYLIQRREETQIARATEVGYTVMVIEPPFVTPVPQTFATRYGVLIGLALGFVGGCALVVLRERHDPALNSVGDVERSLELSVLGTVPSFQPESSEVDVDPRLVVQHQPRSSAAESYRVLRTNIQFSEPDQKIKTLLLSSAAASEGKSVSTANLALAIAQMGQKTLLIDADLRRPTLHRLLHLEREPGLSDVLVGLTPWREAVRVTAMEHLFVLPCGKTPPNPAELLGSAHMGQLLEEWSQEYDRILFDTPPIMAVTDPIILASKCDQTLLVVRAHQTPRETVQRALVALSTIHASVIGVLFNSVDVTRGYGYGYSYYYYYQRYNQGYYSEAPRRRRWWQQPRRRWRDQRHSSQST